MSAAQRPRLRSRGGFTLLEVMVAVAILGLGLTAILSAQAGAFASASHARSIGVATGLGRCKMTEIEEHIGKDGLPALDETESGACCDGDDSDRVRCTWKIEKPELPEPKFGDLDLDSNLDMAGPLAMLGNADKGKPVLDADAGASLASQLAGGAEGADTGGMISAVMNLVYPDLKSLFDASVRRVTVTTTWTEGSKEYSLELVQWVAVPQKGMVGAVEGEFDAAEADLDPGTSGPPSRGSTAGGGSGRTPGGATTTRGGGGVRPSGGGKR